MENGHHFSEQFANKTIDELRFIIENHRDYQASVVNAAQQELISRHDNSKKDKQSSTKKGEEKYHDFIRQIKKINSYQFKPQYKESFQSNLTMDQIVAISIEVFESLYWEVVYKSENQIEAKRNNYFGNHNEKITVQIVPNGYVEVTSKSIKGNFMDLGRNSIRVKLFIHVFHQIASAYSPQKLTKLAEKIERQKSGDDYVIPDQLLQPRQYKEPNIIFPALLTMFATIGLSYIFAITSMHFYIIFLFELVISICLSFIIFQELKWGNYTAFPHIRTLLVLSVIGIISFNQYFQYLILLNKEVVSNPTFMEFMTYRLEAGFTFVGLNMGWIGWVILFTIQFFLIYLISVFRITIWMISFRIGRVPEEVIEFVYHHLMKERSEHQIRNELSSKGWRLKTHQDYVFEAIGAIQSGQEIRRD